MKSYSVGAKYSRHLIKSRLLFVNEEKKLRLVEKKELYMGHCDKWWEVEFTDLTDLMNPKKAIVSTQYYDVAWNMVKPERKFRRIKLLKSI